MKNLFIFFAIAFFLTGCKKDNTNRYERLVYPSHFPKPHYDFKNNPYSYDGFVLGRKLFFDPILSVNNSISCGSCHAAVHGFADHNVKLSMGVFGRLGSRNSPPVFNMLWNTSFMWDGGINHIEVMPVAPITDHNEMAETMENIVMKLKEEKDYPALFQKAFGTNQIDDRYVLYALTQFMSAIISSNSKYDKYITGKGSLSTDELAGLQVFRTHCESCHTEPLFTNYEFINNGLDTEYKDKGRYRITLKDEDVGKFKVPTLRNIMLTYPYMHDGRFRNIDEVLDHYANGIQSSPTLHLSLEGGIQLTSLERSQIKSFLHTLTDYEMIGDMEINEQ